MGSTCSGALIHPEVVVYAGHCGTNYSQIRFGDDNGSGYTVATASCVRHPMWNGSFSEWDYAICTLAEPVADIAIVPPLMGCETDILVPNRPVVMVGWGRNTENGGAGTKRAVDGVISSLMFSGNSIALDGAGPQQGLCPGDSGGPTYIQLDDGSWRQLGVHHAASPSCEFADGGTDKRLYNAVDWIESETGFDVTPCHDADGTWNPGPGCTAFPLDPISGGTGWPTCPAGPLSGPSRTCGAGIGAGGAGGDGGQATGGAAATGSGGGVAAGGAAVGGAAAGGNREEPPPETSSVDGEASCRYGAADDAPRWPWMLLALALGALRRRR
jgi:MYXO-CTERM domain-containing protein